MTDQRNQPFGRPLTEAEAEIVTRNRHLGWDASTVAEAGEVRRRRMQLGLVPLDPPRSRGQVVVLAVLCAACTVIGGLIALWQFTGNGGGQ